MPVVLSLLAVFVLLLVFRYWKRRPGLPAADDLFTSENGEALLAPETDWEFIDEYLLSWDRFARGRNELAAILRRECARFKAELARAVDGDFARAVSPAIMYALLQVGGFVPLQSAVGRALTAAFGVGAPPITDIQGRSFYFGGDLYVWLEKHVGELPPYPLYAEWRQRELTKEMVIPMYTAVIDKRPGASC